VILSESEIVNIILNNPGKAKILKAQLYSKKLRRHIYGEGLEDHLELIQGFERSTSLRDIRAKYTKSNKDLFSRLSRPLDKVFTANGGSIYFNLNETLEKQAAYLTKDIRNNFSVKKWLEKFWLPHLLDDPCGCIFMEMMPEQQAALARQQSKSFVYPTYKSISKIYDYHTSGSKIDWVVFKISKEEKSLYGINEADEVYRVVDDANDYIVKRQMQSVSILTEFTLPNYFGKVPGIINSDIVNPENKDLFLSFYDPAIELADQYLLKGSIKVVHDFLHGFPKYAEFYSECSDCAGTGFANGKKCETCKGTGKKIMTSVSDAKFLSAPNQGEPLILPKDIGGYISPDKTYWEIATSDIQQLEDAMNVTIWQTESRLRTAGMSANSTGDTKTATEIVSEIKPQADRLIVISEMAEQRHKFILDYVIQMNLLFTYQGSSVNYGRRYMIEPTDAIWDKYSNARAKGSPQNVLDTLLNEYYESNYQSDPIGLALAKKMIYVEPFVHYTIQQVQSMNILPEDYSAKLYFSEWLAMQSEAILISKDVPELKESLMGYTSLKKLPISSTIN
jgi:hypothetical protein